MRIAALAAARAAQGRSGAGARAAQADVKAGLYMPAIRKATQMMVPA